MTTQYTSNQNAQINVMLAQKFVMRIKIVAYQLVPRRTRRIRKKNVMLMVT